jgi:DNA-binding response OmpR family regulator
MKNLILLVSDDKSTGRQLLPVLARTAAPAFRVEVADSRAGIEALRIPSVILLDLMLSNEPAFDVLRWLRSDRRYKELPVFVLGSEDASHRVNEAYALGANSCLLKDSAGEELERIAEGLAAYANLIPSIDCASCG